LDRLASEFNFQRLAKPFKHCYAETSLAVTQLHNSMLSVTDFQTAVLPRQ